MRRAAALLATVLLVACADLFSPARPDTYEFRDFQANADGGTDTLTFHWSREMLPVRIYVAIDDTLLPYTQVAISRWSSAFLYGEFQAVLVSDSTAADIIIENGYPPDGNFLREPLSAFATGCSGATDRPFGHSFRLPIHSNIWSNTGSLVPGLDLCYDITVTHELGHALGILNHSRNLGDVMYGSPVLDGLSDRDRQTIETVYHTPANVTITGRR